MFFVNEEIVENGPRSLAAQLIGNDPIHQVHRRNRDEFRDKLHETPGQAALDRGECTCTACSTRTACWTRSTRDKSAARSAFGPHRSSARSPPS